MSVARHAFGVGLLASAGFAIAGARLRHSGDLTDYQHLLVDDPETSGKTVRVTGLGTTMMLIDDGETQILLDPYISHVSLADAALLRPVSTDGAAVDAALDRVGAGRAGDGRVRAIWVSHSHHDHALDLAYIARRTGAIVYGSDSTLNIARGGAVPEAQLQRLDLRTPTTIGNFEVATIASRHPSPVLGGRGSTIGGPLTQPASIWAYKEGGTYDFLIASRGPELGPRMLFKGSADLHGNALVDQKVDALFLGIGGLGKADRAFADRYLDATIGALNPDVVVPTHWNDFFSPVLPNLPLHRRLIDDTPAAFGRVLDRIQPGVRVGLLDAFGSIAV
jgi:L-ascorbate metabolism protein UlaG (beta-lactamase superfamily)